MIKDFSKKELISILEIIETARFCDSKEQFKQLLFQIKNVVSADYCVCGLGKITNTGLSDDFLYLNGNYPDEWVKIYISGKFLQKDPVAKFHTEFTMANFWSDVSKVYNDKHDRNFMGLASDFGLNYGISSGIREPDTGEITLFSFASKTEVLNTYHKKIIDILTLHIHFALLRVLKIPAINHPLM